MYVYILQPRMYVGTTVYKVGMSSLADLSRLRSYGKGSRYIAMAEVGDNYLQVETALISQFKHEFTLAKGREYFNVLDEDRARGIFLKTIERTISGDLANASRLAPMIRSPPKNKEENATVTGQHPFARFAFKAATPDA